MQLQQKKMNTRLPKLPKQKPGAKFRMPRKAKKKWSQKGLPFRALKEISEGKVPTIFIKLAVSFFALWINLLDQEKQSVTG